MPAEWVGSTTPCGLCLHFTLIRFIVSINIIVWIQLCNQSYDNHSLLSYFSSSFCCRALKFPIGQKVIPLLLSLQCCWARTSKHSQCKLTWRTSISATEGRHRRGRMMRQCAVKVSHPSKSALSPLHLPRSVQWFGFGVVERWAECCDGSPSPWQTPMIVSIFSWDEIKSLEASDINLL